MEKLYVNWIYIQSLVLIQVTRRQLTDTPTAHQPDFCFPFFLIRPLLFDLFSDPRRVPGQKENYICL
jgi:hypothetical protein